MALKPRRSDGVLVERNPNRDRAHQERSPLGWDDVRAIRGRAAAGEKHYLIARDYGIHDTCVTLIVNNRTWHDPDYQPAVYLLCERPDCRARFRRRRCQRRFCSARCRSTHNARLRKGYYHLRREEERWRARKEGVGQPGRALHHATSLEAPVGHDLGSSGLAAFVADVGAQDPLEGVQAARLWELVGDVDVDALDEGQLIALRARLAAEGFAPMARAA